MMVAKPIGAPVVNRWRPRLLIGIAVAAGLLIFGLANAHLVYVAVSSQPDCVDHLKERGDVDGDVAFRAARSAFD